MKKRTIIAPGRPLNLSELSDYQDDAVVSRELLARDVGSVTMFAFGKGQGLSEHTAPYDALVQIIDGEAVIKISGRSRTVKRGQLIVLPAGKPHSLQAVLQFKMLLTMIRSNKGR